MTISDDDRLKLSCLLEDLRNYIHANTPSRARRDALLMKARDAIYTLRKGKQQPSTSRCKECGGTGNAKVNPATEVPPGMLRIAQPDQVTEDGILFFQRGISGGGAVYGAHLKPEAYGAVLRKQVGPGQLMLADGVWWFKPVGITVPLLQALRAITSPADVWITDVTTHLLDYLLDQIADNGMSHEIADRIRREHLARIGAGPPDVTEQMVLPAADTSILRGLTRGTVLKLKLCEAEYVSITHAGPVDGKYSGWLTDLDGRSVINTDPRFDTPEEAEQHIRDILAAALDWREPTP